MNVMVEPGPLWSQCDHRLPSLFGTRAEAVLYKVGRDSERAAWRTLDDVFQPFDFGRLAQTTDATTFVAVAGSCAQVLANFDASAFLDRDLGWTAGSPAHLKAVRDRDVLPPSSYSMTVRRPPLGRPRVSSTQVASHLLGGYSVVLDGVDTRDPTINELTWLFERSFGCPVNVNGYVGLRGDQAFGAHWDDHEVVIVQLLGSKLWEVGLPDSLSMEKTLHGSPMQFDPVWSGVLAPGSCLYVPRGWPHRVSGRGELTFHLTISIPRPRVQAGVAHAIEHSIVPTPVGVWPQDLESSVLGPIGDEMRTMVAREVGNSGWLAALGRLRSSCPPRQLASIASTFGGSSTIAHPVFRSPFGCGYTIADPRDGRRLENRTLVAAGGRTWWCDDAAIDLLAEVLDPSEVPTDVDGCSVLWASGLIEVCERDSLRWQVQDSGGWADGR